MKKETLILVINASIALTAAVVIVLFHLAPWFTVYLLGICLLSFLFILTERWQTHHAAEFENRFWTCMAFLLARTCLFCDDSPLRFPSDRQGVAWCIVWFFTYLAHTYDRHLRRLSLTRSPNIRRLPSAAFGDALRESVRCKAEELRGHVNAIDMPWMSSTFLNLFFLPRVLFAEHQIITTLAEATADELNLLFPHIALPRILYKVKDHRLARRFNRVKLLDLLAKERVCELTVASKAILLDALQKLKLTAVAQSDHYVKSILFSTKGDDLSELKCITDCKGDVHSMHKLVYQDIRSPATRNELLHYIRAQASIQAAHHKIGSKTGKRRSKLAWRKVLSDVDDTLYCSGGSWPAGMDTSYPKKELYPGVLAFYRELDLGATGAPEWEEGRLGNLAFLSARPHVYKSVSEDVSYEKFLALRSLRGLYTMPTLLAGSLDTGGAFMLNGSSEPLAQKKFDNFKQYIALYPEFTTVFIGDNGQGDARMAELVLQDPLLESFLNRAYVRVVQPVERTYLRDKQFVHNKRVCFFCTYVDAALDAYREGLISVQGLRRVMVEAANDFLSIPQQHWANLPVPSRSEAQTQAQAAGPVGDKPAGTDLAKAGEVCKTWRLSTLHLPPSPRRAKSAVERARFEGLRKQLLRADELNRALVKANEVLAQCGLEALPTIPYPQLLPLHGTVLTDFGIAKVTGFRSLDGIYEVAVENSPIRIFLSGTGLC